MLIVFLLIGLVASIGIVSAFDGFGSEHREAKKKALETGDYETWKEIKMSELTEERFKWAQEKYEQRMERRQAMHPARQAVIDGDYDAWAEAISGLGWTRGMAELINEDNFDVFVKMHEARTAGDFETANALAEELGLIRDFGRRHTSY